MTFDFFKKLFGKKPTSNTQVATNSETISVPESVLDRFVLNSPEFFYFDAESGKLIFSAKGKDVKIVENCEIKAGVIILALFWLRDIAKKNRELFNSIILKYAPTTGTSDKEMHEFLWNYYRTGQTAKLPQLIQFYNRGYGIIHFLDSISKFETVLLDESLAGVSRTKLMERFGNINTRKSVNDIADETLIKLIYLSYHQGEEAENNHNRPQTGTPIKSQEKLSKENKSPIDAYLLLFSAEWCGPSKRFKKEIIEGGVTNFSYIDVDSDNELSEKYRILSVPTTILIKTNGDVIQKWTGYDDEDPGQSKFIKEINSGKYNIRLYPGIAPYKVEPASPKQTQPVATPKPATAPRAVKTSPIKRDVDNSISAFESGNISLLQDRLFQLISQLNKPRSGRLIIEFPEKDRLCECFSLCLRYDWMHDSDIREVWAENGFYCIIDYLSKQAKTPQDRLAGGLDLFLHIQYGKDSLAPKVDDILRKATMRGEPFFDRNDYAKGANYVIKQFQFLGAILIKPFAEKALNGENYNAYLRIINDPTISYIPLRDILLKAQFISRIIESILEDM